jgi:hypothetical protein
VKVHVPTLAVWCALAIRPDAAAAKELASVVIAWGKVELQRAGVPPPALARGVRLMLGDRLRMAADTGIVYLCDGHSAPITRWNPPDGMEVVVECPPPSPAANPKGPGRTYSPTAALPTIPIRLAGGFAASGETTCWAQPASFGNLAAIARADAEIEGWLKAQAFMHAPVKGSGAPAAKWQLGRHLALWGLGDQATTELKDAGHPQALIDLGDVYAALGKPGHALAYYKMATQAPQKASLDMQAYAECAQGRIRYDANDVSGALSNLERALALKRKAGSPASEVGELMAVEKDLRSKIQ